MIHTPLKVNQTLGTEIMIRYGEIRLLSKNKNSQTQICIIKGNTEFQISEKRPTPR